MYDLTIMGDVTVQECVVNGSLTVLGNARITNLTCQNELICKGDLYSEKIYVGGNMIVDSVACDELICDGNAAIQTTVNINQVAQIAKTIVACEGIMGAGKFTAQNAVANEYFEFDGNYEGKILELETDSTISNTVPQKAVSSETIEEIIGLANQKLTEEYSKCTSLDEERLIDHLRSLGGIENKELKVLPIIEPLFSKLADLSYQSRIETIEEYLTVLVAKKLLPDEVFSYESIDHIGKQYLPKARSEVTDLVFEPTSVAQFARVLSMAVKLEDDLSDGWEAMVDKEFCNVEVSDFEEVEMYDPAPTLFIQDELHLIRESLGTYASHYESFIDYFVKNVSPSRRPIKIIGATATISSYATQISQLYSKDPIRFPCASPDLKRNFYSYIEDEDTQRLIMGYAPYGKAIINSVVYSLKYMREVVYEYKKDPEKVLAIPGIGITTVDEALEILKDYWIFLEYNNVKRDGNNVEGALETPINVELRKEGVTPFNTRKMTGDETFQDVREVLSKVETNEDVFNGVNLIVATSMSLLTFRPQPSITERNMLLLLVQGTICMC